MSTSVFQSEIYHENAEELSKDLPEDQGCTDIKRQISGGSNIQIERILEYSKVTIS